MSGNDEHVEIIAGAVRKSQSSVVGTGGRSTQLFREGEHLHSGVRERVFGFFSSVVQ